MQGMENTIEARVVEICRERKQTLVTAESCTGGLVACRITSVPGASDIYLGSVVSYANAVKCGMLGVTPEILARDGAVSAVCAEAMACGVRERLGADLAVAVTGVAGPDGGTLQKPVGLVFLAVATTAGVRSEACRFGGNRAEVRMRAADRALTLVLESLG
ncbi:MAG TPA: nicotinamide-nucleotide amidohydrolase family protein [Kiritimatiellia bacterium]|nr:nicotinamide-nucleotide amidohydrolase family protein [Kiritimatiellia bacterium]HRU18993.1 nicotinamide-nucleotide amidohydrolase family protein [Kiritimatiellia bacterium]